MIQVALETRQEQVIFLGDEGTVRVRNPDFISDLSRVTRFFCGYEVGTVKTSRGKKIMNRSLTHQGGRIHNRRPIYRNRINLGREH